MTQCQDCVTAAWTLRRMGFRDSISWGTFPVEPLGRTPTVHAFSANSDFPRHTPATEERQAGGRVVVTERATTRIGDNPLPFCTRYRSELAWLTAGKPQRVTVYMAHPVAGNFDRNVTSAVNWLRWLRSRTPGELSEITRTLFAHRPLICAPWLAGIEDIDGDELRRETVMRDDLDSVTMYDEVWMVVRVSEGMQREAGVARVTRDLTFLGPTPPTKKGKRR